MRKELRQNIPNYSYIKLCGDEFMIDAKDYCAFVQGQRDCKNGVEHRSGKGEHYDRGYSTQYEQEQVDNWMSEHAKR